MQNAKKENSLITQNGGAAFPAAPPFASLPHLTIRHGSSFLSRPRPSAILFLFKDPLTLDLETKQEQNEIYYHFYQSFIPS